MAKQNTECIEKPRLKCLDGIHEGMIFQDDVLASNGVLLIPRNSPVTSALLARLRTFAENEGVREPIRVRWDRCAAGCPAAHPSAPAPRRSPPPP